MHLLYSRFFIKALRDMGIVSFDEPFIRLFNQGTIVVHRQKMSKSRGNVITPDEYVAELGADAVRAYLMFIGPWDQGGEWDDSGIIGISRWLNRVWNVVLRGEETAFPKHSAAPGATRELLRFTHKTIKKVTSDMERFHFNTMLAALMEFTNCLAKVLEARVVDQSSWRQARDSLLLLLAPTAPHLAEELWTRTGHPYSIHQSSWPKWDEELTLEEQITLVVQIDGKVRDKVVVPASITEAEACELALSRDKVRFFLKDKEVTKTIFAPKRLVNLVTK
jgi:leucyl-tRNA synthetase